MWKDDFSYEEFADRQHPVRAKMEDCGIDLLLVFHPANIQYLVGIRAKSYQEFQVLFFPLEETPLTMLARLAEVPELTDPSLAEDVRGWGGREPEDPLEVFATIIHKKGYLSRRIRLEIPDYFMHPYHYEPIKDLLGEALTVDAIFLIHDLKGQITGGDCLYSTSLRDCRFGIAHRGGSDKTWGDGIGSGRRGLSCASMGRRRRAREPDN